MLGDDRRRHARANVLLNGQAEREVIDGHVPANAIIRIQEWEVHPDNTGIARINRLKVLRKYYRPQYKARSPWPGTEWEPHPLVVPADELQVVRDAVKCEKEEKKARSKQAKREAAASGKSRYAEPEVVQSEDASAYARMRAQEMGAGKGKEAAEEPKNEEDGHEHVAEAPRAHDSGRSRREEEQQRQKALVEERRLEKAAKKAAKKKKKSAKVAVDGDATADAKATEEDIEPPDATEAALTRGLTLHICTPVCPSKRRAIHHGRADREDCSARGRQLQAEDWQVHRRRTQGRTWCGAKRGAGL